MANASLATLLPLDRYADIMGITPMHFNGATAEGTDGAMFPSGSSCSDVWYQYSWQRADQVGRDDLARAIRTAEIDIAKQLGYWPAPTWMESEAVRYPRYHRRDLYRANMKNVRGQFTSVDLRWGKFIQGGRRISDLNTVEAVDYDDADLDGFNETATVTAIIADADATLCEIKVYHEGHDGDAQWEIRPRRSGTLVAGTFTATFWSWQFILPALLSALPVGAAPQAIDISTDANFVVSVEVRRTYNDHTASHGTLFWEKQPSGCPSCGGLGCPACAFDTQSLCLHVRDTDLGRAVLVPSSYDTDSGYWVEQAQSVCRDPDQAAVNYYAGEQSDEYLAGYTCDPLPHYIAEAIAWLATARLERPFCACGVLTALADDLRRDLTITGTDKTSWFVPEVVLDNPFGTRLGEVKAWMRISNMMDSVVVGVAI